MTIAFWQFVPLPYADKSENYQALKISNHIVIADKLLNLETRPYKEILITKENLKDALEYDFAQYGISNEVQEAERVISCESSWNINASNKISYGIAQFTPATWKDFGYGDILNPLSQLDVMAKMWKDGLQGRWDCFRQLKTQ